MKKVFFYSTLGFLFLQWSVYSQSWVQTGGTPQGNGVTDILVRQSNGWIYVTTGSYNWPSEPGGVRVSTDNGDIWQNQTFSYVARTIIEGTDGNLYASIWPDPGIFAADGLYRSTNNGAVWTPLGFVQAGDNIFSIATSPTTPVQTIFAGTRNGVIRSTDNGSTFQNTSNGIPANSWVRDLEVKSNGAIYAATYSGLFKSSNNGDNWLLCGGIEPGDTVLKLCVYNSSSDAAEEQIMAGTQNNKMYEEGAELFILAFAGTPVNLEISGLKALGTLLLLSQFGNSNVPGGIRSVYKEGIGWTTQSYNEGLPGNRPVSALTIPAPPTESENTWVYVGYFENRSFGAKIFKRDFIVGVEDITSEISREYKLEQNYPNPFNPSTKISWQSPISGHQTLKVYDVLGNEIAILVNEYKPVGNFSVDFDGSRFASGVYLYRLQVINPETSSGQGFVETKKMILQK